MKLETLANGNVLVDGVEFVPKSVAPEQEPARIDVREYARQHRYWVAKEKSGTWLAYTTDKGRLSFDPNRGWGESALSRVVNGAGIDMYFNCTFPDVPWDKSLIAPDGSMPLFKSTPQRGDPVFVWDNCADDTIPAPVWYFHHIGKDGKVYVYSSWTYGRVMESPGFENYRPFDAALVGVPRKDWPKAKEV